MIERHVHGILAHCRYPLSTGVLEGCNNKVKVHKRMAYGYRDDAYLLPQHPRGVSRNCRMNEK